MERKSGTIRIVSKMLLTAMAVLLSACNLLPAAPTVTTAPPTPSPTFATTAPPTPSPTPTPSPAPTAVPTAAPTATPAPAAVEVSFVFSGDLMFHKALLDVSKRGEGYDFSPVLEPVAAHIGGADFAVANLEAPVYDPKKSKIDTYRFAAPPEAIRDYAAAGFDVFTTANNHATDQGAKGLSNTIDVIRAAGLHVTGTWRSAAERDEILMLEHGGVKVAILAYGIKNLHDDFPKGMGSNIWRASTLDDMAKAVKRAKAAGADAVIVSAHFGDEYTYAPNPLQKRTVDEMRKAGALAVIGHHPHVLQPMFMDADSTFCAAYSLGNLVTATATKQRQFAALLKLTVRKDPATGKVTIASLSYVPTWTRMLRAEDGKSRLRVYDIREALAACKAGTDPEIPKKYLKELTDGYAWIQNMLGKEYLEK